MNTLIYLLSLFFLFEKTHSYSSRSGVSRPWDLLKRIKAQTEGLQSKPKQKYLRDIKYSEEYVDMKLDHFAPDDSETFKLRLLINSDNYKVGGPIFFYCGNEGPITDFWDVSGWIYNTLAPKFGALVVFAEHRYFGKSFPRNWAQQDYDITKNKYLTVEQTLSDFAVLLQNFIIEKSLPKDTKIIAFGGSYGGMLAAWGRMKFPHVYAGAIASSAPILLFEDINKIQNSFFKIITDTYKRYDNQCPTQVRAGFDELYKIRQNKTSIPRAFEELNNIFSPCTNIQSVSDVRKLESTVEDAIVFLAQYNYPYDFDLGGMLFPANPAKIACEAIHDRQSDSTDIGKLKKLKAAASIFYNNTGSLKCLDIGNGETTSEPNGWSFLACTEMIMPMQKNGVSDMFNPETWDLNEFSNECKKTWSGDVRPRWAFDFFGGRNFVKETNNFSNIVYINGQMDPWNSGCPQISDNPKVKIFLADSAHHLDLRTPNEKDPESMIQARKQTRELLRNWLYPSAEETN